MIRPLLIIGVGGAGGKTIRAMKQELNRILESSGYTEGLPDAWQFLHIDTTRDGASFPAPMLSAEEFHCVVPDGVRYGEILGSVMEKGGVAEQQKMLSGWGIPAPTIAINSSPRQERAIGRLAGLADFPMVLQAIWKSISMMQSPTAQNEIGAIVNRLHDKKFDLQPQVLIFSSLGGTSGSGMFIDVAEAIKRSTSSSTGYNATTFLFAPDVFKSFGITSGSIAMNALGAMNELIAGGWNDVSEQTENSFLKMGLPRHFQSDRSSFGSSTNYLVDTNSIKGLSNLIDPIRATADDFISSFAVGFINALITGKLEFYPDNPIDLFQPSGALFIDKSGLMPEIFANSFIDSHPAYRFHPLWSFSSLTEPILEEVAKSKNQTQTWVQFWEGRRSRPLIEAIPFETEMRKSIITGWFIARLFGLTKIENLNSGRCLKIWNPTLETPDWSTFPSPLLDTHPEDMKRNSWLLPQLLMSAGIALANFGKSGNPEFINGYRLLKYLGREVTTSIANRDHWDGRGSGDLLPNGIPERSRYVLEWVAQGSKPEESLSLLPLLQENLATKPNSGAALIASLETIQSSYQEAWKDFVGAAFHHLPETWELREDIDLAISDIAEYVRNLQNSAAKNSD